MQFAHHFISARFQNVFTSQTLGPSATVPKLEHKIIGTIEDGPKVWVLGTKMAILVIHKKAKWPFLSQCTNVGDGPEDFTS